MIKELLRQKRIHNLEEVVTDKELELLKAGTPIQKIIGFINFEDLQINVNHDVLIPRYETQEVLMKALEFIKPNSSVLDLCAGSGYIGLTVKQKNPSTKVTLSDISKEAILQINENAKLNNLDVEAIESDLFKNINKKFDVIISNPPYILNDASLPKSVTSFEPHIALFGGLDGNDFYRRIIKEVSVFFNDGGVLIFEIAPENAPFIKSEGFEIFNDINNKERIAVKIFN